MIEDGEPIQLLEVFELHVRNPIKDAVKPNNAVRPIKECHDTCKGQNHFDGCILMRERKRQRDYGIWGHPKKVVQRACGLPNAKKRTISVQIFKIFGCHPNHGY